MEIRISFELNTTGFADSAVSVLKKAKQFTTSVAKFAMTPATLLIREIDFQMTAAAMRNASRALLLEASENQNCVENASLSTAESACE